MEWVEVEYTVRTGVLSLSSNVAIPALRDIVKEHVDCCQQQLQTNFFNQYIDVDFVSLKVVFCTNFEFQRRGS